MKYFENVKQVIGNFELAQNSHKSNFENKRKKRKLQTNKKRNKFSKKKKLRKKKTIDATRHYSKTYLKNIKFFFDANI